MGIEELVLQSINGTFYSDVIVFENKMPKQGLSAVKFTGFFWLCWSIENGDFIWNL